MTDDIKPPSTETSGYAWRRNLHLFPNTVFLQDISTFQFGRSYAMRMTFRKPNGERIKVSDEVAQGALPLWVACNKFIIEGEALLSSFELACNAIAVVDGYKRHDDIVTDAHLDVLYSMTRGDREHTAIGGAKSVVNNVVQDLVRLLKTFDGVLKGENKVRLQDRLQRITAETTALQEDVHELLERKNTLPRTPHAIRQRFMSEALERLDIVIKLLAPLNRSDARNHLPQSIARRIALHVSILYSVRSRLKKWRDNPSQRFGSRFAQLAKTVETSALGIGALKDESYDLSRSLGVWFFDRSGFVSPDTFTGRKS